MRTVAGMEGGYSKRLQKQFCPPLSRAVTHRHRRYRYGACTKVCTGAGGSHAPTPHVAPTHRGHCRGDRLHTSRAGGSGHAHTVYSTVCMHIVRTGQEGRGTHTWRAQHRAWTLCTEMVQKFSVRTLQGDRAYTRHGQSCTGRTGQMHASTRTAADQRRQGSLHVTVERRARAKRKQECELFRTHSGSTT